MAYLFKLSSRLIIERHLSTMASDAYGIGLKRPVLPATNTMGALQQFQTEIASLAFGRTHWARNCVRFFSPLNCCLCSPGLYIKGQDWIWFFVVVVIFLHFFINLTPHRTLVSTHNINKCAKFGSILVGVSRVIQNLL